VRLVIFALLTALAVAGCAGTPDAAEQTLKTVTVRLHGPDGQQQAFTVEVAADTPTRRLGLMHRTELPPDAGMLFVFPQDTDGGFWMKDTLIPLSIAFADAEGTVVAVLDMEPCEEDPCPSYRPGAPYRMALEVNQGELSDVRPGWRLEVDGTLPPVS
jgi:uncharacterized protein